MIPMLLIADRFPACKRAASHESYTGNQREGQKNEQLGKDVVGESGIEPETPGLEGRCSIQLSYSPVHHFILPSSEGKVHW